MTANGKHFFKSSTISGWTKRSKIKRACRCEDGERRKKIEIINYASYHFIL